MYEEVFILLLFIITYGKRKCHFNRFFNLLYPKTDWWIFIDYRNFVIHIESACLLRDGQCWYVGMSAESQKGTKAELSSFFRGG